MSNRDKTPDVLWGAGFAKTWQLPYPLDDVTAWTEDPPGTVRTDFPSGLFEAWRTGTPHGHLRGVARYLPAEASADPVATGWNGTDGIEDFLEYVRDGNAVRFVPDRNVPGTFVECYLVEPREGPPELDDDNVSRRLTLVLRAVTPGAVFAGY